MANVIGAAVGIIIFILGTLFVLKFHYSFVPRRVNHSDWQYFKIKWGFIGSSIFFLIIASMAIGGLVVGELNSARTTPPEKSVSQTEQQSNSQNESVNNVAPTVKPSTNEEMPNVVNNKSSIEPKFELESRQNSEQEHHFTNAEITAIENEKNYHGDDPIIRKRLGIPVRNAEQNNSVSNTSATSPATGSLETHRVSGVASDSTPSNAVTQNTADGEK
jgi:hypothetical protein